MRYVRFKYPIRFINLTTYPATQPLNNIPANGKGQNFKLTDKWLEFIYSINSEQSARYLLKAKSGWVNQLAADGTPISESLTMGGNVAIIDGEEGNFYKLYSLHPDDPLPALGDNTIVHKFTCWNIFRNRPALPGIGLDVYYPFLTAKPVWVSKNQVEVFGSEPLPNWPGLEPHLIQAVMLEGAIIYQRPGEVKIRGPIPTAEYVQVLSEYNGWTKIGDKRYVASKFIRYMI